MNADLMKKLDDPKSTRDFRTMFESESVVRESISEPGFERVDV